MSLRLVRLTTTRTRWWPALLIPLGGCALAPAPEPTALAPVAPTQWQAEASPSEPGMAPATDAWLHLWNDPTLDALVREALVHNRDLAAAAARLEAAAARARRAGAALGPTLDADASAVRTSSGDRVADGAITNRFDTGLNVAWELDLWGDLRLARESARLQAEASREDLAAAQLSIAGLVARGWFDLVEADQQIRLAQETLKNFSDVEGIIRQRFERGLNTALDLRLARANVASARAQLANREQQRAATVRSLEVLLGRYPAGALAGRMDLPALPSPLPAGLPADVLTRRPDIASRARALQSAERLVGVAERAYLPNLRLTGSGGYLSTDLDRWLKEDAGQWSLGGALTLPIFESGRLRANEAEARANLATATAAYQTAALTAFREVETALAAQRWIDEREAATAIAAQEYERAEALAVDQYQRGLTTIVTVLESQRRASTSRSDLLAIRKARLQNRLDLYLALGGAPLNAAEMSPVLAQREE